MVNIDAAWIAGTKSFSLILPPRCSRQPLARPVDNRTPEHVHSLAMSCGKLIGRGKPIESRFGAREHPHASE